MNMQDKVVLVTGATGNLGRAVVQAFSERGARLVLVGRSTDSLQRSFGEPGDSRLFVTADLTDVGQTTEAVQRAVAHFARIDVLCHLTGGFRMGEAVHETSADTWDFLLDINARTLVNVARAVVPHMLAAGSGKIVTMGATAAQRGAAHMGAYSASKASVIRLTEAMSAELKHSGINVNCVLPSIIDTPENRQAMANADPAQWVAPEALAEVIAFLASDAARAIHGVALPVTGLV